jgi:5-(carboxyamino)imidazole ribonucleotide synthase
MIERTTGSPAAGLRTTGGPTTLARATAPLAPGSTIGILGGGQLGRMLGFAALALGYRVAILDPDPDCPARAIADRVVVAPYDDVAAALDLAAGCAVVTYELEHVGAEVVAAVEGIVPVRPGHRALRMTQDRLAERRFLVAAGAPVAPWREVRSPGDLRDAAAALGYPLRLKAALGGYDGRSQVRVAGPGDVAPSFAALERSAATAGLVAERELEFGCELSVVCARGLDGTVVPFAPARNRHDDGILVESVVPAPPPVTPGAVREAWALAARLATELDLVGVLTVELFLLPDGSLVANELAPRVHNSGHHTIEACRTSQFEQHVRAICGLPLGSADQLAPAAMVNLLGTGPLRPARLVGLDAALADDRVHVHVYGKRRVFERRKMGHVTATSETCEDALGRARRALAALSWAETMEDEATDGRTGGAAGVAAEGAGVDAVDRAKHAAASVGPSPSGGPAAAGGPREGQR